MKKLGLLITGIATGLIMLTAGVNSSAAERPEIIRHDVTRLENGLNFIIMWQSSNPVTRVVISAGREQKEIRVDEYDNRRNPDGYSGEVSAIVPTEGIANTLQYTIQLEDDIRLRSEPIAGKIAAEQLGNTYQPPMNQMHVGHHPGQPPQDDANWGKEVLKPMPSPNQQQVGPAGAVGDIMGKLMEVYDRHDTPPSITAIKVNLISGESVSFSSKAIDDKGLREVRFKVLDGRGTVVGLQVLTNLGKVWEGTSQTFQLGGGNFRAVAQAIDTTGNTSKEETETFVLSGQPKELAAVQEPPITVGTNPPVPGASEQSQSQTMQPDQTQNIQQQYNTTTINVSTQQPAATQTPVQQPQESAHQQPAPVTQEQQQTPVQQGQPAPAPPTEGQSFPGL